MMSRMHKGQGGFTLIEILVVVVILGILASIIIPKIMTRPEEAKRIKAKMDIKAIETALNLYRLDNDVYPSTEQGLEALVAKPTTGVIPRNWKEDGYLDKVPKDPWGNPYVYLSPGVNKEFDLESYGTDGVDGGEGKDADIENWDLE
jgi:general secretion pathway protein G